MKRGCLAVVLTILAAAAASSQEVRSQGSAESAGEASALAARRWSTRLDAFNPQAVPAAFGVDYLADTAYCDSPVTQVAPASTGRLLVDATFPGTYAGAGIMSASGALPAVYRQVATSRKAPSAPMFYSPFRAADAGLGQFFVPLVQRARNVASTIGVQNLEGEDVAVSLEFLPTAGAPRTFALPAPVRSGASAIVNPATLASFPRSFAGSLVVRANKVAGGTPAKIVASAAIVPASGLQVSAFSGMSGTAHSLLFPRAQCTGSGGKRLASRFEVQNAGTAPARVEVTYYFTGMVGGAPQVKSAAFVSRGLVDPGRRTTVDACATKALRGRKDAVAVVSAKDAGGAPVPVAALVRHVNAANGTINVHAGQVYPSADADGKYRAVLPSVEWVQRGSGFRTFIDIMNAAPVTGAVPRTEVSTDFYGATGRIHTVRSGFARIETDAATAGALTGGRFDGAVVLESDQPFVAAARVQKNGASVGDGYTALPSLPPPGAWTAGPPMCFDLTRIDAEFFPATGKVYILGGRSGVATVGNIYSFDPATGACVDTGAALPVPVSNYLVSLVNDGSASQLCTFGGRNGAGGMVLDVQCYNPLANTAAVVATLPAPWANFLVGGQEVVGNKVYLFGGFNSSGSAVLARTDEYDPVRRTFTQLGDLSLARAYLYTGVVDGKIYAFGGDTYPGAVLTAQTRAERLDPATGIWDDAAVADLPAPLDEGRGFGFDTGALHGLSGKVLLAGGGVWSGWSNVTLVYDAATNTYDGTFPDLITARRNHAAAFVNLPSADPADGRPGLWLFGGYQGSDSPPYAPAEFFPLPESNLFFPLVMK